MDEIISSSITLGDPDESREYVQKIRASLLFALKPRPTQVNARPRREIDELCKLNFPCTNVSQSRLKETKRIWAWLLLHMYRREPKSFDAEDFRDLVKRLEEMVCIEDD